jgi:hypothetical protein
MKNKIDKIVVLLFILAMFFIMSISAHAETGNRYFFTSEILPSRIELDGVTITPANTNASVVSRPLTIFNEDVKNYVKVWSGGNADDTDTQLEIKTDREGVLLVYYVRQWVKGSTVNDVRDLNIIDNNGFAEYTQTQASLVEGVKYFILEADKTYTMTANYRGGVYGFVYMPGNVAAYNVKGKGDFSLIGQSCTDYTNLPNLKEKKWRFEGWYKDQACTEKVDEGAEITEPTILFARWTRYFWDFEEYSGIVQLDYKILSLNYDGLLIMGSDVNDGSYTCITDQYLGLYTMSTTETNCVVFTPEYDGEMTVTYSSTSSQSVSRYCAIGTDVVNNANSLNGNPSVVAYGVVDNPEVWKTLQAKLKAGVTYYIFNVDGGIKIDKMQYQASAASAVVDGNNVSLTVAANMQGWRPFYDANNSYTVDDNTKVYMVVEKENEEDAVILGNRTGNKVPMDCPVILRSNAVQEDGTYLITMTKDATPYEYEGNDNLLSASVPGTPVNAYRLGYRAGAGNGVAFYSWSADTPSAGIVYLDLSNSNTAKIELNIENSATGITSVRNKHNEEDKIFNINGQRLNVPKKGFNIINGKKVIVL